MKFIDLLHVLLCKIVMEAFFWLLEIVSCIDSNYMLQNARIPRIFIIDFSSISLPQAYNSQCSKPILSVPYVSFIYSWLTLLFHIFPIFFYKNIHILHILLHTLCFFSTWWCILMVSLFEYTKNCILNDSIVFPYVCALI